MLQYVLKFSSRWFVLRSKTGPTNLPHHPSHTCSRRIISAFPTWLFPNVPICRYRNRFIAIFIIHAYIRILNLQCAMCEVWCVMSLFLDPQYNDSSIFPSPHRIAYFHIPHVHITNFPLQQIYRIAKLKWNLILRFYDVIYSDTCPFTINIQSLYPISAKVKNHWLKFT